MITQQECRAERRGRPTKANRPHRVFYLQFARAQGGREINAGYFNDFYQGMGGAGVGGCESPSAPFVGERSGLELALTLATFLLQGTTTT